MDGSEFTLDQTILRSRTRSEGQLDMKEQRCSAEISEEMISHQESGDGRPALEQGPPKAAVADKGESDASVPIDHGVSNLRAGSKELEDQSQHRGGSESIRNSPSQPNNPWPLDHEPHRSSLKSQMASQLQHENEMEAKEDVTWISQRTGKLMKCKDQQTSRIWEFKPLSEILQRSVPESQVQDQESMKGAQQSRSEEGTVSSEEAALPTKQEPCFSGQLSGEQELPCGLQPEEGPSHLQPQPSQNFQELRQPPEEKKPRNDNKEDGNQAFPRTGYSSQEQPSVESHPTWISPKTGLQMICKSQQTSRIWEFKPLSEILGSPVQDSQKSLERKRRTESKSEAKVYFTEGIKSESLAVDKSSRSQQRLASGLQPPAEEWDLSEQAASSRSPRSSQMKLTNEDDVKEEITWVCLKTGFLMKCKSQQTSSIWDGRLLSEILHKTSQATETTGEHCETKVDCVSKINREMTVSYTEEEEELRRTYSIISENEGILFNRKTHRILTNRSQQTNQKALWTPRESSEDILEADGVEGEQLGEQEIQGEGPQSPSLHNKPLLESPLDQVEASGGNEGETLEALSDHQLTEDVLFQVESSFVISQVEDDLPSIYEGEGSGKEGSFYNTQTGKLLESQCLQTDTLSVQAPDAETTAS